MDLCFMEKVVHGVGLCQIGAAVMGDKGVPYEDILQFYYPGTELTKMW